MAPITYHSTDGAPGRQTFVGASLEGLAADGGLFMPSAVPRLPSAFFLNLGAMDIRSVAYCVIDTVLGGEIPSSRLKAIVDETFNWEIPLRRVTRDVYALELWHGPTGCYKDIAARFMARIFALGAQQSEDPRPLLAFNVAVGSTGAAIADGFADVPGVKVVLLCPRGTVLPSRHTSSNVIRIEVAGTYDDCQRLIRQAMGDTDITDRVRVTVINSINLASLLGEAVVPFQAYARLREADPEAPPPLLSVPCGNLGSLTAAAIARRMGLPLAGIVGAANANDSLGRYLEEGRLQHRETVRTVSPSIDVAEPANLRRLASLFKDTDEMRRNLLTAKVGDEEAIDTVRSCRAAHSYALDPHGAVALHGLLRHLRPGQKGIFYATLNPRASASALRPSNERVPFIPPTLAGLKRILSTLYHNKHQ